MIGLGLWWSTILTNGSVGNLCDLKDRTKREIFFLHQENRIILECSVVIMINLEWNLLKGRKLFLNTNLISEISKTLSSFYMIIMYIILLSFVYKLYRILLSPTEIGWQIKANTHTHTHYNKKRTIILYISETFQKYTVWLYNRWYFFVSKKCTFLQLSLHFAFYEFYINIFHFDHSSYAALCWRCRR
mgnify:CR=1 FL=1